MAFEKHPAEVPSPSPAIDSMSWKSSRSTSNDSLPSEPSINAAGLARPCGGKNDLEIEATRTPTLLTHHQHVPPPSDDDLTIILRECNIRLLTHRLRSLKRRLFLEQVYPMGQVEPASPCDDIHCRQSSGSISDHQSTVTSTTVDEGATSPKDMIPSSKDKQFHIPLVSGSQPETINRMTTHAA